LRLLSIIAAETVDIRHIFDSLDCDLYGQHLTDATRRILFTKHAEIIRLMSMNVSAGICGCQRHGRGPRGGLLVTTYALLAVFVIVVSAEAAPADGFWKHSNDPVWIEVNVAEGTGIAVRNDDQPQTVGFQVVRELITGDDANVWKGEVYVPQLDNYKSVSITLLDQQTLRMTVKIGFLRRSVEWSRVESINKVNP